MEPPAICSTTPPQISATSFNHHPGMVDHVRAHVGMESRELGLRRNKTTPTNISTEFLVPSQHKDAGL